MSLRSQGFSRGTVTTVLCVGLFLVVGLTTIPLSGSYAQEGPFAATQDTTRITFDEAVRLALDQNTDLKRAQANARQSNTRVQSEWMDFAPNLSVSTNVSRRFGRNFSQVTGDFTTRSTDFFNMSGRSDITLFNGFENVASLREAKKQARASQLDVKRTQREVAFTVMDQFIALLESQEQIRVRREQLDALEQQLQQMEEFVDAGSRPVSDLYQLQADVADAEQQLLQGKRQREVNRTRLIQTLQLNPRQAYDFQVPGVDEEALGRKTYELASLIDNAFQNRLDLEVAESERRAAKHSVKAARSRYYPTLSVGANYGTDWTSRGRLPDPDNPGQFLDPTFSDQLNNNRGGGLSITVSIPIFDRLQRSAQVEQAQVQAQNAEYALQDQRQQVALEVRQAYLDYRNAVQQLEASNTRKKAAAQAREATQERYNLGSASTVELRNANRDFVDAASQQVRARYNLLFRQKQIDYRVGRLNPRRPLQSVQAGE